jgi:hypothetical protein
VKRPSAAAEIAAPRSETSAQHPRRTLPVWRDNPAARDSQLLGGPAMKQANPASNMATYVAAILSLILPASAMPPSEAPQSLGAPEPPRMPGAKKPEGGAEPRERDAKDDPILRYRWGPGGPDLSIRQFHVRLGQREHRPVTKPPS